MRIDPLGTRPEKLTGRATSNHEVALAHTLSLQSGSVIARGIDKQFPGLRAVQITILVDEIDIDPDAEDLLSYTFWCEVSSVAESVVQDDIIRVELEPVDLLTERRWVAKSLEIL